MALLIWTLLALSRMGEKERVIPMSQMILKEPAERNSKTRKQLSLKGRRMTNKPRINGGTSPLCVYLCELASWQWHSYHVLIPKCVICLIFALHCQMYDLFLFSVLSIWLISHHSQRGELGYVFHGLCARVSPLIMEDLKCLICFEDAKDARACPRCAKIYCSGCIKKWGTNRRAIPCPHCRAARPVQDYVKLNFVDRLRKEWSEKEEIAKATSSKLDQLRSKNEKLLKQVSNMGRLWIHWNFAMPVQSIPVNYVISIC